MTFFTHPPKPSPTVTNKSFTMIWCMSQVKWSGKLERGYIYFRSYRVNMRWIVQIIVFFSSCLQTLDTDIDLINFLKGKKAEII